MNLRIGDKVIFKNDKIEGVVVKINSQYKVKVSTLDGFDLDVSTKELIKVENAISDSSSYGKISDFKDSNLTKKKQLKKKRKYNTIKVDLHMDALMIKNSSLENFEILQLQTEECHNMIKSALNSSVKKIEIIHGKGEGILKKEVHKILLEYNLRFYLTKDGGATEVYL